MDSSFIFHLFIFYTIKKIVLANVVIVPNSLKPSFFFSFIN